MKVTGGRIPYHTAYLLGVTEEDNTKIVVRDCNPMSKSGFLMTILLTVPVEEPHHALAEDESEVRCLLQWDEPEGGRKILEGEAHLRSDGSIRCDCMECLEFWMELSK